MPILVEPGAVKVKMKILVRIVMWVGDEDSLPVVIGGAIEFPTLAAYP